MWIGLSQSMKFIVVPGTRIKWRLPQTKILMVGIVVEERDGEMIVSTQHPPVIGSPINYIVLQEQLQEVQGYVGGIVYTSKGGVTGRNYSTL